MSWTCLGHYEENPSSQGGRTIAENNMYDFKLYIWRSHSVSMSVVQTFDAFDVR